jgi:hypothetical protein
VVDLPDARGREGILKVHLRNVPLAEDVEIADLARSTPGFSGAQLENLVNEAAIRSARLNQEVVTMADFLEAKDRSLMGRERRSLAVSARDRTSAAYREAGHVLVAWMLPGADPVQKVTIIPRAHALGTTVQVPEEDHHTSTKQQIESAIAIRMARRCAEEIFLGSTTSAVADDLREATKLARQMVCEWGMAEETKHLGLGEEREVVLAGTEVTRYRQCSEETSARVDVAVRLREGQKHPGARKEHGRAARRCPAGARNPRFPATRGPDHPQEPPPCDRVMPTANPAGVLPKCQQPPSGRGRRHVREVSTAKSHAKNAKTQGTQRVFLGIKALGVPCIFAWSSSADTNSELPSV